MKKFKASWEIFLRTLEVMKEHPSLLVYPALIASFTLMLGVFFLSPIALQPTGYRYNEAKHWNAVLSSVLTEDSNARLAETGSKTKSRDLHYNNRVMGYLAFIYFVSMFFAAFFNVAFCSQTMAALRGQPVSFQAGLRFAMSRWKPILFWSLMTGLVGFLIQKLQENFGFVGRIVIGLIGLTWSVASVFAIPVLVEGDNIGNPLNVLRQSALTIKKTWGESLIGFLGLQLGGLVSLVVLFLCGAVAVTVAVMTQTLLVPLLAMAAWVLFTVAFSYLSSVAGHIYQSALYLYASTGSVPTHFEPRMMDAAWKRQRR